MSMDVRGERLQKVLARAGVASRRAAEEMIALGRVTVDGKRVTEPGTKVDPSSSRIEVDGKALSLQARVYFALNKPPGVVTTLRDPEGRRTVGDLLAHLGDRVFPVGRLDYDAEGLLLVTNDGELANKLSHPRFQVRRTYDAKVRGVPSEAELDRLRQGVRLEDGLARPLSVEVVGRAKRNTWVRVDVAEGRNHLVKRLFEHIGHPVQRLRRISFGGVGLENLEIGGVRQLNKAEIATLWEVTDGSSPRPRPSTPPAAGRGVKGSRPRDRGPSSRLGKEEDNRQRRKPTSRALSASSATSPPVRTSARGDRHRRGRQR